MQSCEKRLVSLSTLWRAAVWTLGGEPRRRQRGRRRSPGISQCAHPALRLHQTPLLHGVSGARPRTGQYLLCSSNEYLGVFLCPLLNFLYDYCSDKIIMCLFFPKLKSYPLCYGQQFLTSFGVSPTPKQWLLGVTRELLMYFYCGTPHFKVHKNTKQMECL